MYYVFAIFALFLLTASASFVRLDERWRSVLFFACWLACLALAGFRGAGRDADSLVYLEVFNGTSVGVMVEPSFHLISSMVRFFCGPDFLFVLIVYACIGVTLKFAAIRQLTDLWMLSCVIYIANMFILNDLTQIRTGVAAGMLLLCIKPLYERNWKYFLLFAAIGAFFHMGALFILPLWFLNPRSLNKYACVALIVAAECVFLMDMGVTDLIGWIPLEYVQQKLRMNQEAAAMNGVALTPFGMVQLFKIGIAAVLIWKSERVAAANKYLPLLLKTYILGIAAFPLFTDIPAFSVRISEFYSCVEVVLIPLLFYAFKDRRLGVAVPVGVGLLFVGANLFIHKLIT